jgi:hypothetical protein
MLMNVLDGDGRFINQDADGQRQPTERHDVNRLPRQPQTDDAGEDRKRDPRHAVSSSLVTRIRRSATVGSVLDGINAASLALMAVVTWRLGRAALVDWTTVAMLVVSLILLIRFRVNSAGLVPVGALFGLVFRLD